MFLILLKFRTLLEKRAVKNEGRAQRAGESYLYENERGIPLHFDPLDMGMQITENFTTESNIGAGSDCLVDEERSNDVRFGCRPLYNTNVPCKQCKLLVA